MNMLLLGTYILSVLALLATPGPVIVLVTATAAAHGSRKALFTVLGADVASLLLIAFALLILLGMISLPPAYLQCFGVAGSVYLGWCAICGLLSEVVEDDKKLTKTSLGGFTKGFITGISNPKDILFFASFFPQFIAVNHAFTTSIVTLSLVWVVLDLTILTTYVLLVKYWLNNKHTNRFLRLSSLLLFSIAVAGLIYNIRGLLA